MKHWLALYLTMLIVVACEQRSSSPESTQATSNSPKSTARLDTCEDIEVFVRTLPSDARRMLVLSSIGYVINDHKRLIGYNADASNEEWLWAMKVGSQGFALLSHLAELADWREVAELLRANAELMAQRIRGEIDESEFERRARENDAVRSRIIAPYTSNWKHYAQVAQPWEADFERIARQVVALAKLAATPATRPDKPVAPATVPVLVTDTFIGLLKETTWRPGVNVVDVWANGLQWEQASPELAEVANAKVAYIATREPEVIVVGHDGTPTVFAVAVKAGFDHDKVCHELASYLSMKKLYEDNSMGGRSSTFLVRDGDELLGLVMVGSGTHERLVGIGSIGFIDKKRAEEAMGRALKWND